MKLEYNPNHKWLAFVSALTSNDINIRFHCLDLLHFLRIYVVQHYSDNASSNSITLCCRFLHSVLMIIHNPCFPPHLIKASLFCVVIWRSIGCIRSNEHVLWLTCCEKLIKQKGNLANWVKNPTTHALLTGCVGKRNGQMGKETCVLLSLAVIYYVK